METPTQVPPTPAPTETAVPTPTVPPVVAPFEVPARAVAILEADCGAVLYGKDEHVPLPPASLTKIVTALAVINRVHLSDTIVSDISARELKQRTRSSVMGLEPGMTVSIEDLLYGLFLPSGNDAAILLAKHVSGSVEAFAALMNETAASLGMNDSRFDNPHGLDSDGLKSSAYDLAVAGMALMQNPTLAAISGADSYTLSGGLSFRNGNRLLDQYPGAYGVKIGNTRDAGRTIVGAAERDGRRLFITVLDSPDLYNEASRLLDWAFTLPRGC
jgi:D-alanyl-D-alanine carboxypeptidase